MTVRAKFGHNNLAKISGALSASSEAAGFPASNLLDDNRSTLWKAEGIFEITLANQQFAYKDGSTNTTALTPGTYTGAGLAAAMETAINAGPGAETWTVTYNTSTYKFDFSSTGSTEIMLSVTTNAIWDTIGFVGTDNRTNPASTDEVRIHTSEWLKVTLSVNAWQVDLAALINELGEVMSPSPAATITLKGSNIDDKDNAPLSVNVVNDDRGYYVGLDDVNINTYYKYYWFIIEDRENPEGPESIQASVFYLGDSVSFTTTNIATGFEKGNNDLSVIQISESGRRYSREKKRPNFFRALQVQLPNRSERLAFEQFVRDFGQTTPFFISLDPGLAISDEASEMSAFVHFDQLPPIGHRFHQYFDIRPFSVSEVV